MIVLLSANGVPLGSSIRRSNDKSIEDNSGVVTSTEFNSSLVDNNDILGRLNETDGHVFDEGSSDVSDESESGIDSKPRSERDVIDGVAEPKLKTPLENAAKGLKAALGEQDENEKEDLDFEEIWADDSLDNDAIINDYRAQYVACTSQCLNNQINCMVSFTFTYFIITKIKYVKVIYMLTLFN